MEIDALFSKQQLQMFLPIILRWVFKMSHHYPPNMVT